MTEPTDPSTPAASAPTQRVALIVAVTFFMAMLDGAILNTSLPLMAQDLRVTPLALAAAVTMYLLGAAAVMPASGWLATRFEARRVFLLSIALFTAASAACGLAQDLPQLVLARAVQGVAAGLMSPIGRTLVLRQASKSELMAATALLTWPALLAPVLGPPLGGFISTYASWHWNFFLNVPVGLLGLAAVWRWVPRTARATPPPLDLAGAVLCAASLVLMLLGLERAAQAGSHLAAWQVPALLMLSGLVIGVLALRHLRRVPHPLIGLAPLQVRTFSIATVGGGTWFMACLQATPFLLPLMLQLGFGFGAVQAGLFTLAYFLGNLSMKTLTTPVLRRFGFARAMQVGGVLAALAIAACALLQAHTAVWAMVALLLVAGALRSMQMTAMNTLAFADVAPAQRGDAATLSSLFAQVAMALAAAGATLLLALSQALHGREVLDAVDFRWAFGATALVALLGTARFWQLRSDDGAEVSGHRLPAGVKPERAG